MIIVDSKFTLQEVLSKRQQVSAPAEILARQRLIDVSYYSFDGLLHQGQIVIDNELVGDVKEVFALIMKIKFPVAAAIPYTDRSNMSEEQINASLRNTSGFNYRYIVNKESKELSNHALGRALDINPFLKPYINGEVVIPKGAEYDPIIPGTITADGELVSAFKSRGWSWGGDWTDLKDYMHFEKLTKHGQ